MSAKAFKLQKEEMIQCINCTNSSNPIGWPKIVWCSILKSHAFVAESNRKCNYYQRRCLIK